METISNAFCIHKAPNTIDVQAHAKLSTFQHHFFVKESIGPTILSNEFTMTLLCMKMNRQ